ncbi:MAG TPA: TetR family transcriptional regulator [Spirochaetia bacterium]|jgi:AcrR family transcriptional regulator|nr:TetR family transcriptional regulator [Spirochaetia bacterium]
MRSLTDQERQVRRDLLADHALGLFAGQGYAKLTVEAVARAAGVAKGTVFQAFASKEDLFLHAVRRRFEAWFTRLAGVNPAQPPAPLARDLLSTLRADNLLLPLLALVGPVLEEGCSAPAVVEFKGALAAGLSALTAVWAPHRPDVPFDAWAPLFLEVYALTVGAWTVGEASVSVRGALADRPELGFFLTRFEDLFVPLATARLAFLEGPVRTGPDPGRPGRL